MDVREANRELTGLKAQVAKWTEDFTARTGIVVALTVEPDIFTDRGRGVKPEDRLLGYKVADRLVALDMPVQGS